MLAVQAISDMGVLAYLAISAHGVNNAIFGPGRIRAKILRQNFKVVTTGKLRALVVYLLHPTALYK